MSDVEIAPCRGCGIPKRIDTECVASDRCIELQRIWREEHAAWMRRPAPTEEPAEETTT